MDSKSIYIYIYETLRHPATIPAVLAPSSSFHTFRCVLRQQVVSTIKKVMQRESRKNWEAETYLIILEISWDFKRLFMLPRRIHLRLILWQKQLPSSNAYRSISAYPAGRTSASGQCQEASAAEHLRVGGDGSKHEGRKTERMGLF